MDQFSGGVTGKPWTEFEVEATVGAYFEMLDMERRGQRYAKVEIVRSLRTMMPARSHAAIEYKFSNISAILDEIGLPWIDGYKPQSNYQQDLRRVVTARLATNQRISEGFAAYQASALPPAQVRPLATADVLVPPPSAPSVNRRRSSVQLNVGPITALKDFQAKELGNAGEEWVVALERAELARAGRADLAKRVEWTAREVGDGTGYDVASFFPDGRERLIEVKTTNYGARTPFYLTLWEVEFSALRPEAYSLYRVHGFARDPRIYVLDGSVEASSRLDPKVYLGIPL
jgi:hypothetical protein